MFPSTILAFAAAVSSLVAVNGAILQRGGTLTSLTSGGSTTPTATNTTSVATTTQPSKVTSATTTSPTGTAGTTPTPSPTGAGNCDAVQQWNPFFAYTAGDKVIFNNQLFTARQWTYDNAPPSHADQWTADGTCTPPINNQANCSGVSAWQSNVAYTAGNHVTFNGHLWSAVEWTEASSPGGTAGVWMDLGACT